MMLPTPGPNATWEERRAFCRSIHQQYIANGYSPAQADEMVRAMVAYPPEDDQADRIERKRQAAADAIKIDETMGPSELHRYARNFVFWTFLPKPNTHTEAVVQESFLVSPDPPFAQLGSAWPTEALERFERVFGRHGDEFPDSQPDGKPWSTESWKSAIIEAVSEPSDG